MCFAAGVTQFYTPLLLGRTLNILPRETVKNPGELLAWYRDHPRHGLYCVPTLWNELVCFAEAKSETGEQITPPSGVFLSGEAVAKSLVGRSFSVFPDTRLWNLYGPTEVVANASYTELRDGDQVMIGRPIDGTEIYLLDSAMRPVPASEPGEICIVGDGVASRYVNLPQATQERFVPNPFSPGSDKRLFKTGDMARRTESGDLDFIGRRDFQLQVRGHRVECGEIEAALQDHPAVRQAVVVAVRENELDRTLAAYLTFRLARYATVDVLRGFLADRLPDYMIPKSFVLLEKFPKLASGKIDRTNLPAPGRERPALAYAFVAPATVREMQIVRIWEEVLGVDGVGTQDDFFELGGDSLGVAAVLARVGEAHRTTLSYADFFDHATPAAFSEFLGALDPISGPGGRPIKRQGQTGTYPCSQNQRSLWLLCRTFPDQIAYNIQFSVRFEGDLDPGDLETALGAVVRRNESLRTVIAVQHGQPMARTENFEALTLPRVDLRQLNQAEATREADRLTAAQAASPFDLEFGPLYRFRLVRVGPERQRLLVTVHHIIFDGRSINLFCRDLLEQYRRIQAAEPDPVRGEQIQYRDWSAWREGPGAENDGPAREYWRESLMGSAPDLKFPADFTRPPVRGFEGSIRTHLIRAELKERLGTFNRAHQTTAFMTLLAVFKVLLFRYSGQDDILVGTPVANRRHSEAEDLIGFLANTIVLRSRLRMDQPFTELLAEVRKNCLDSLEHQSFPFD